MGGMLSLVFFYAIFAGCTHTAQFHESLKRVYQSRARSFDTANHESITEMSDLSGLPRPTLQKRQNEAKKQKEFMDFFSFDKYIDLHKRVEHMERELDRKRLV